MSKKEKPAAELRTERFAMRAAPSVMKLVDEWRRQQPDLPSRTEAIHRLLEQALSGKGGAKK